MSRPEVVTVYQSVFLQAATRGEGEAWPRVGDWVVKFNRLDDLFVLENVQTGQPSNPITMELVQQAPLGIAVPIPPQLEVFGSEAQKDFFAGINYNDLFKTPGKAEPMPQLTSDDDWFLWGKPTPKQLTGFGNYVGPSVPDLLGKAVDRLAALDKSVKSPDLDKSTETHKEPGQDEDGMINGRFL